MLRISPGLNPHTKSSNLSFPTKVFYPSYLEINYCIPPSPSHLSTPLPPPRKNLLPFHTNGQPDPRHNPTAPYYNIPPPGYSPTISKLQLAQAVQQDTLDRNISLTRTLASQHPQQQDLSRHTLLHFEQKLNAVTSTILGHLQQDPNPLTEEDALSPVLTTPPPSIARDPIITSALVSPSEPNLSP